MQLFTNLTLYTAGGDMPELADLEQAVQAAAFVPCRPTQEWTAGFVPPRGHEHGALVEAVGGQWIAEVMFEKRMLPSPVVKRLVAKKAAAWEQETGRKPGKKMLKELKEEARHELLPQAFTQQRRVPVWIDPVRKMVAIDTASAKRAEVVATLLTDVAGRMNLHALRTREWAPKVMSEWVESGEAPAAFTLDREAELRSLSKEVPTVIRLVEVDVSGDDVRDLLREDSDLRVVQLAMTFNGRVSFSLHGDGSLRAITLLGAAFERPSQENEDPFDANVAIATGELAPLIDAVIAELGGIAELPIEEAAKGEEPATSEAGEPVPA